jgi:hypothetical protein
MLWIAFATMIVVGLSASVASADSKIVICHKGQDIEVDVHAVSAHLDHGDLPRSCTADVCACSDEFDPVTCTLPDGTTKTFANQCQANCAGATGPCGTVGACSDIFNPVTCTLPDGTIRTFANACQAKLAGCTGTITLLCPCGLIYAPVRCSDGTIFINACVAACQGASGCTPLQ